MTEGESKNKIPTVDEALEKIIGKKDFTKTLYQRVTACTRSGGGLPSGHEYSVQTALPQVSAKVDRASTKTLALLRQALSMADDQFGSRGATSHVLGQQYDVFEDAVDNIADTIDECLKPPSQQEQKTALQTTIAKHKDRISKPQRHWKSRIDNYRPRYVPVDLKTKLNAKLKKNLKTISGTYVSPGSGCVVKKHSVGYVELVFGCLS